MTPALVGAARLIKAAAEGGAVGAAFRGVDLVPSARITREAAAGAGVVLREVGLGGSSGAAGEEGCSRGGDSKEAEDGFHGCGGLSALGGYAHLSFWVRGGDSKRPGELVQVRGSVMKKPPRTLARPSQNRIGTGTEKPMAIAKKPPMINLFFIALRDLRPAVPAGSSSLMP